MVLVRYSSFLNIVLLPKNINGNYAVYNERVYMETIKAVGEYKRKSTGEAIQFNFEYPSFVDLQDAIDSTSEEKVFKLVQRMVKVDASNTAREEAKVANGDSTRVAMTEAQKAEAKAERVANKALLEKIKALLHMNVPNWVCSPLKQGHERMRIVLSHPLFYCPRRHRRRSKKGWVSDGCILVLTDITLRTALTKCVD